MLWETPFSRERSAPGTALDEMSMRIAPASSETPFSRVLTIIRGDEIAFLLLDLG